MKKLIPISLIALVCQLLSACTNPGQFPNAGGKSTPDNQVQEDVMGTGDGGGGNALNYKMLESHLINPQELPIVKSRVAPLLKKIFPPSNPEDKGDIFALKNWYLAPMKLKSIPKDVLGIDFTPDRLQQVAIQTDRAIWIDSNYFEKMNEEEKARLIVHELLMGVYLTRFYTMSELCMMSHRIGGTSCDLNSEQVKRMESMRQFQPESKRRLTDSDYEAIRAATAWVFANEKDLAENTFNAYKERIGFADKRFNYADDEEGATKLPTLETTVSKLVLALKKAQYSGNLEKTCLAVHTKQTFNCELMWSLNEKPHPQAPSLKIYQFEVAIKETTSQKVVQKSTVILHPEGKITLTENGENYSFIVSPTDLFTTSNPGSTGATASISLKVGANGDLTLKGVTMIPIVYVGSESVEEVRNENGKDQKYRCEKRLNAHVHPENISTDTLILKAPNYTDMQNLMFLDLIEDMPMLSCQLIP